jgi:hypothetical protein
MIYLNLVFCLSFLCCFSQSCRNNPSPEVLAQIADSTILTEKNALSQLEHALLDSSAQVSRLFPMGIIRDKETAIAVAEPILFGIYGREQIVNERPYTIQKTGPYWCMEGHLKEGMDGGIFRIQIDARDGRVVGLIHGK